MFEREILPGLQPVPVSDLLRAIGLTHRYPSQVRRALNVPYPRHWPGLRVPRISDVVKPYRSLPLLVTPLRGRCINQPGQRPHCRRCGGPVPHARRVYCDACLPHYQHDRYQAFAAALAAKKAEERGRGVDPSHGGAAAERRGLAISRHRQELEAWREGHPDGEADGALFEREIMPGLLTVPLSDLVRATGLTRGYLSQVRRGLKVPHPRHWPQLRAAVVRPDA